MLKNVYEGLNARPKVYLSKEYFCEMYPTCVSSKLCEFIPVCDYFSKSAGGHLLSDSPVLDLVTQFSNPS